MPLRNKLSDTLFRLIIGAVYAYALSWAILSATILEVDGGALLRLCLLLSVVWCLLLWNKWTFLPGLGLALLFAGGTLFSLYRQEFEVQWWIELSSLVQELFRFAQGQLPYRPEYSILIAKGLALLVTLISALNLRVGSGFYILTLLAAAVCAVPLYMEWGVDEAALVLLALCLLALLVHKLNLIALLYDQYGNKSAGAFALLLLPVCAAVFLLAGSAPKPDVEAIREQGLPDVSGVADNLLYHLMPDQIFSWSKDGEQLGGPRHPNDIFVMEVEAPGQVYLGGSVRDLYTGTSWNQSRRKNVPLKADDSGGYDVSAYGGLRESQLYYMRYYAQPIEALSVITGEARTKTIFTPAFAQSLFIEDIAPSIDDYGMMVGDKPLPKEQTYTQRYIAWDFSNQYLQRVLRELSAGGQRPDPNDKQLAAALSLPETLPQRVRELALSLTQGLGNNYDKLLAIQEYLSRFPYTLEPEAVPTGEDFVDYFLFSGQEGYCVYYATAMAVLGRCADIPTRYLEGFVLPGERNINGNYTVTNQQAHAWVEAWFPGFGWVRFDPTPSAATGAESEEEAPSVPVPQPEPSEPESSLPEVPPPASLSRPEEPEEPESSTPEEPEESEPSLPGRGETPEEKPPSKGLGTFLLVLLVLSAAGGGLYLYGRHRMTRYQQELQAIETLSNREATIVWFGRILKAVEALGYPIQPGETALTYARRVEDALSAPEHPLGLRELAEIFCLASYSGREISDAQRVAMQACYQELTVRLEQARRHKIFYYRDRYLLGKF